MLEREEELIESEGGERERDEEVIERERKREE